MDKQGARPIPMILIRVSKSCGDSSNDNDSFQSSALEGMLTLTFRQRNFTKRSSAALDSESILLQLITVGSFRFETRACTRYAPYRIKISKRTKASPVSFPRYTSCVRLSSMILTRLYGNCVRNAAALKGRTTWSSLQ